MRAYDFYSQVVKNKRTSAASEFVLNNEFTSENNDIANQSVHTSFFTSENKRVTNTWLLSREETILIWVLFSA